MFPIVARTLQKRLKKYEALTGVKSIRVHDIRHSHVAYLIYQGVEPLIIKERLGHKDIQMTLNTYGHLYPSQQKKVAGADLNRKVLADMAVTDAAGFAKLAEVAKKALA